MNGHEAHLAIGNRHRWPRPQKQSARASCESNLREQTARALCASRLRMQIARASARANCESNLREQSPIREANRLRVIEVPSVPPQGRSETVLPHDRSKMTHWNRNVPLQPEGGKTLGQPVAKQRSKRNETLDATDFRSNQVSTKLLAKPGSQLGPSIT